MLLTVWLWIWWIITQRLTSLHYRNKQIQPTTVAESFLQHSTTCFQIQCGYKCLKWILHLNEIKISLYLQLLNLWSMSNDWNKTNTCTSSINRRLYSGVQFKCTRNWNTLTLFLQGFLLVPQEHWLPQWIPTALQGQLFLRWHVLLQEQRCASTYNSYYTARTYSSYTSVSLSFSILLLLLSSSDDAIL